MNLFQLFKASLHSPKKIAAFRLIPIGKVMQYVFIYIFLLTIIAFIQFVNGLSIQQANMEDFLDYFHDIQWLLYPFSFIFLFVLNTLFTFVRISIIAYIGVILLTLFKRKGEYRHMWRSVLFASTISMLISLVVSFLNCSSVYIQLVNYLLTFIYLFLACKYYPIKR